MELKDIMTTDPVTTDAGATLVDAARIMLEQHLTSLPVVEAGRLVGILTDGDLLCRAELGTAPEAGWLRALFAPETSARAFVKTHGRRVSEVMTQEPVTVAEDTSVEEVVALMMKRHFKQIPVTMADRLVGLIGRHELLTALVGKLAALKDEKISDDAAETLIRQEINRSKWAPRAEIDVEVINGVAELSGPIFSDAERRALIVMAENTNGVKEVRDHMVFVEPNTGMAFGTF